MGFRKVTARVGEVLNQAESGDKQHRTLRVTYWPEGLADGITGPQATANNALVNHHDRDRIVESPPLLRAPGNQHSDTEA